MSEKVNKVNITSSDYYAIMCSYLNEYVVGNNVKKQDIAKLLGRGRKQISNVLNGKQNCTIVVMLEIINAISILMAEKDKGKVPVEMSLLYVAHESKKRLDKSYGKSKRIEEYHDLIQGNIRMIGKNIINENGGW